MATDLKIKSGDIVRYADGASALFKVSAPHADGWHGHHVMGGVHYASDQIFNKLKLANAEDIEFCRQKRPEWFEIKSEPLTFKMLISKNIERCEKGFGHNQDSWSLLEWGGATAGEIGEACNIAKKIIRYRDNVKGNKASDNIENLKIKLGGEIADGIIYAFLWASAAGIDLEAAVRKAFNDKSDEITSEIKL